MSKGNPFLALRLSPETIACLREASSQHGCGVSDLAREALTAGLLSGFATTRAAAAVLQDTRRLTQRRSRCRKPSRIQRVFTATDELRELLTEYQDWQANQPEFAASSATADKLEAAIEALETAIGALEELDLPRGFGRD